MFQNIFNSQIQKLALQMVIENIAWTPYYISATIDHPLSLFLIIPTLSADNWGLRYKNPWGQLWALIPTIIEEIARTHYYIMAILFLSPPTFPYSWCGEYMIVQAG
jgi:hypothetical protein